MLGTVAAGADGAAMRRLLPLRKRPSSGLISSLLWNVM